MSIKLAVFETSTFSRAGGKIQSGSVENIDKSDETLLRKRSHFLMESINRLSPWNDHHEVSRCNINAL